MTTPPEKRVIRRSDRLYDVLLNFFIEFGALGLAATISAGGSVENAEWATIVAFRSPIHIKCQPVKLFHLAIRENESPDDFELQFVSGRRQLHDMPQRVQESHKVTAYHRVFNNMLGLTFLSFYERHRPWLQKHFGGEVDKWPQLFRFAWALRNAITHHEGEVNFENPKCPSVTWNGLTYSPADNGRLVFGPDLGMGDFIVLMLQMSDELDRLGCPASL